VDDAAPFLPVGADFVGVLRDFETVTDGKRRAGFCDHLLGFVEGVDRERDDRRVFLFEFFQMRLVIGNLPNAVGSPNAAVKDDDGIFAFKIGRESERPAVGQIYREGRKKVAGVQLSCHRITFSPLDRQAQQLGRVAAENFLFIAV